MKIREDFVNNSLFLKFHDASDEGGSLLRLVRFFFPCSLMK